MITTYNKAVTDTASGYLEITAYGKKPQVTRDVLDLCDEEEAVSERIRKG